MNKKIKKLFIVFVHHLANIAKEIKNVGKQVMESKYIEIN